MTQILPKVIPINELKNTAKISALCSESDVPIVVTRNGYGEMVLMSVALYERTFAAVRSAPTGGPADRAATDELRTRVASGAPEGGQDERRALSAMRSAADEPAEDEVALLGAIYGD